jgi:hypothetical protein
VSRFLVANAAYKTTSPPANTKTGGDDGPADVGEVQQHSALDGLEEFVNNVYSEAAAKNGR